MSRLGVGATPGPTPWNITSQYFILLLLEPSGNRKKKTSRKTISGIQSNVQAESGRGTGREEAEKATHAPDIPRFQFEWKAIPIELTSSLGVGCRMRGRGSRHPLPPWL